MRVNISYTEELDKLPDLIGGFLVDCTTALMEQATVVNEVHPLVRTEGFTMQALEQIDNVRKELARIDQRLEDSAQILAGVHNYKIQLATTAQEPLPDPDVVANEATIEETENDEDGTTEPEAG